VPDWPYTWGRRLRFTAAPIGWLLRAVVTQTHILGGGQLAGLPERVIFAGTHHGFADLPLLLEAIGASPARRLRHRLIVAVWSGGLRGLGPLGLYAQLAFGLYPLQQQGEREASLRRLARLTEAGNSVVIFPQGVHATPADERVELPAARFKVGVGHLAEALAVPVVPFGLAGSERLLPPDITHHRGPTIAGIPIKIERGPLAIAFGAPIVMQPDETPAGFALRLQALCFALTRQAEAALAVPARPS
jgi:1-acyl-sn-glycerol-3-phosphate acyltransferase